MSAHKLTFPTGGSFSFRNLVGKITLVDPAAGTILRVAVDSTSTVEGKRASVPIIGGLPAQPSAGDTYHDLQVFATVDLRANTRIVTSTGVYDVRGKVITPKTLDKRERLNLEIDAVASQLGPNVWVSWTVSRTGKSTIKVIGDGTVVRKREIVADTVSVDEIAKISSLSELVFSVHTDIAPAAPGKIVVGDVVAFGFPLAEFQGIKELRLEA